MLFGFAWDAWDAIGAEISFRDVGVNLCRASRVEDSVARQPHFWPWSCGTSTSTTGTSETTNVSCHALCCSVLFTWHPLTDDHWHGHVMALVAVTMMTITMMTTRMTMTMIVATKTKRRRRHHGDDDEDEDKEDEDKDDDDDDDGGGGGDDGNGSKPRVKAHKTFWTSCKP